MTQYQQVLDAVVNKLGGKGTTDEIFRATDTRNWKTKTKKASVASYLSTSNEFRQEGNVWIYEGSKTSSNSINKNALDNTIERGLYFITLNPAVKPPIPGLVFKIGKSDGRVKDRLNNYNASLPYKPIQELCFYRIPSDIDLQDAEKQVRNELLCNETLGFGIERFFGNHQDEWLHTLDLVMNSEDINKLAMVVNRIIKETIDNLRKNEEETDEKNEETLHCSDGVCPTAIARNDGKKWTIFGISVVHGFGNADYEKALFNATFDDIIPFNSMSGVSYVAVKKTELWGLIRFRLNPEFAVHKKNFRKALGNEPIDEKAMDPLGREIKFIEDIKYPDIDYFKNKYHLDNLDRYYDDIENNDSSEPSKELREWSDESIEYTKDTFSTLEFGVGPEGTVRMKRNDGSFGFIPLTDALSKKYNVHHDEDGEIDHYSNVSEMIEDGWVLD
jgi:hypothetical protein